jgi:hypothetical protein
MKWGYLYCYSGAIRLGYASASDGAILEYSSRQELKIQRCDLQPSYP